MITLDALTMQRGTRPLLEGADAVIHAGQKAALIGANGSGKSSLFELLLGRLQPEKGSLSMPPGWRIAHMAQEVAADERTAIDHVLDGDSALRDTQAAIAEAERAGNMERLAQLHQQLDDLDGYTAGVRAAKLLQGLGFSGEEVHRPLSSFSGGWRIRLNLARALMCPSDLLLLDEPTNHLDMDAGLWLEDWLRHYQGTLILISHDRDFIDNVCDLVVHIEHRRLNLYRGNYSAFEHQRAERLANQQAAYEKQQRRIAEIQQFVRRFRAKATKARQAQSRLKELERMEQLAPAHVDSPFDFAFPQPERTSDPLLDLSHGQLGYPGAPILREVSLSLHPGSRIGLLGANGAGKSTLIRTLAGELPLLAGRRMTGEHLAIGYFSQHQVDSLDLDASPLQHLQRLTPAATEQRIRDFLGGFDFRGDMALEPVARFSGGEKARLALAIIVWLRPNLLLLDEPTNHLDLDMRHALSVALQGFEGAMVLVSHDRHLIRNSVDRLLLVNDGRVADYDGDLDSYGRWLLQGAEADESPAPVPGQASVAGGERKQQRRDSAEQRRRLAPFRKALTDLERRIESVDSQLADIDHRLSDASLYEADNKERLRQLLQEQGRMQAEKSELEDQWLEKQEELDSLEAGDAL